MTPDETGWKVGGTLHWLWVAATPTTTVFRIAPGRGFDDAAALLGANFAGILVRDGWAPYRPFTQATHQTCLAPGCTRRSSTPSPRTRPCPMSKRLARHLVTEADALLVFLVNPTVDATNWRAEHAIRPAVVTRKVCGGHRTARGAGTQQVLASVLRTLDQRGLDPTDVLTPLLHAPQPIVAPALRLPPR